MTKMVWSFVLGLWSVFNRKAVAATQNLRYRDGSDESRFHPVSYSVKSKQ